MSDEFHFDKIDTYGEHAEFSFPKGQIIIENPDAYFEKFKRGELTPAEKKDYYNYLLSNLEQGTGKIADQIYGYILRDINNEHNSNEDLIFIALYTVYLFYRKTKYDENGKIKEGYEDLSVPSLRIYKESLDSASGWYEKDSKTISVIHIDIFNDTNKLLKFIQRICHESRHYIQEYEMHHGIMNESSFSYSIDNNYNDCNYWFNTTELDAEEQAIRSVIEIFKKYISKPVLDELNAEISPDQDFIEKIDNEFKEIIEPFESELDSLLRDKKIAFAVADEEKTYLTDVSDIMFLLEEANTIIKMKDYSYVMDYFYKLVKSGIIPKILVINSKGQIILQSEESLLESYFSTSPEEKVVYEKALKYLYTYEADDKSKLISEDSYYSISKMKIHFIEEQIEKEKEYLREVKDIIKRPIFSLGARVVSTRDIIRKIYNDIINIRLKRLSYYIMFTKSFNNILHSEAEALFNEFKDVYDSLSRNTETLDIINDSYKEEASTYDFDNNTHK